MQPNREMIEGERVMLRLHGEGDEWFSGTVLDRPRKMWVQLDRNMPSPNWNCEEGGMIADESNIAEWRPASVYGDTVPDQREP